MTYPSLLGPLIAAKYDDRVSKIDQKHGVWGGQYIRPISDIHSMKRKCSYYIVADNFDCQVHKLLIFRYACYKLHRVSKVHITDSLEDDHATPQAFPSPSFSTILESSIG